tara:strand:+ start:550 stop:1446 length:897 start_codon:yes stop_codon:yes gene_type:complete
MKLLIENWNKFINEKALPGQLDPKMFPQKLSQVQPQAAQNLSKTGGLDGVPDDDVISVQHKPEGIASVGKLKPSQSSMNIEKAMAFVLNMLWPGNSELNAGGDLGAFVSNDGYIMDGHHRWIATAMIDPSSSVGGYLVDFPGQQLVAILNTMTKGLFGVERGKEATGGFDQFTPEKMKEQLMQYAQGGIWSMKAEDVMNVLQKWTGAQGEEAIDAAVQKMSQNIGALTFETPSWASDRADMPVIDDKNVAPAAKALGQGQINVNSPYKKGGQQSQQQAVQQQKQMKEAILKVLKNKLK